MKRIGIISAMKIEMASIKQEMMMEKEEVRCGFTFFIGRVEGAEVVLTACSVGKVNAACCTQVLIDHYGVECVINTGIAGGIHESLKLQDVVISSDVTYFDVRKIQMKNCYPNQESFKADVRLVEDCQRVCKEVLEEGVDYYVGRIATGDNFIADSELKEKIKKEFMPYCVEMEGGAIGHVAFLNQVPFVVIRSISDLANDVAEGIYEAFEEAAAKQSAQITLKMISALEGKVQRGERND